MLIGNLPHDFVVGRRKRRRDALKNPEKELKRPPPPACEPADHKDLFNIGGVARDRDGMGKIDAVSNKVNSFAWMAKMASQVFDGGVEAGKEL